jgi:hypothetical protein
MVMLPLTRGGLCDRLRPDGTFHHFRYQYKL